MTTSEETDQHPRQKNKWTDFFNLERITRSTAHTLAGIKHRRSPQDAENSQEEIRTRKQHKDKGTTVTSNLALRAVYGNLTVTRDSVIAWYAINPRATAFSPLASAEEDMKADALAYSKLVGRRCFLRSSHRPYSVTRWAEQTWNDASTHGTPLPGYGNFLLREQDRMARMNFSEKWVYLGVRLTSFRRYPTDARREAAALASQAEEIDNVLRQSSLGAKPARSIDMEWLLRRSVGLGLPCPSVGVTGDYEPDDVAGLKAHARWTGEPMAGDIKISGEVAGRADHAEQHVSVLTLGRLSDQEIPQRESTGWMQRTDRLPFPVEWSATFDVISEERSMKWLSSRLATIDDQMKHYVEDHGMAARPSLQRQANLAYSIQEQVDSDHGGLALRTEGWYRMAIAGRTKTEVRERVAKAKALYGSRAELVQNSNQYAVAREFIPGESLSTNAHKRRMAVTSLAGAIPHGTAEVGDRQGITLGYTSGSASRATAWDTHADMEQHDRSGLTVIGGELGSGKTHAFGSIIYKSVMSGVQWSVLDPSDRLGRLCGLSELKDNARYVNLMKGRSGELNPYRVVAEPKRDHFDSQDDWERACADARGTRSSLMADILHDFLPKGTRHSETTESVLGRALADVTPEVTSSSRDVLDALHAIVNGETHPDLTEAHRIKAQDLIIVYERIAQTPVGKLIFPPKGAAPVEQLDDDEARLTVYTLNGLQIPDEKVIQAGDATETARLSMAVVQLAAWLVQSRIYLGDPNRRKGLGIDEGKVLASINSGKTLITKSSTDSRKFNTRVLICSQNVTHFDMGDSEDSLGNLVGSALIGATQSEYAVAAALKVLRVPQGQGYESILESLRPPEKHRSREDTTEQQRAKPENEKTEQEKAKERRHFIFFDGAHCERIVIDSDAHPQLTAALNSRPSSSEHSGEDDQEAA
ncbi:ATP-binding protein [Arthrobacter pigmenti]